MQCYNDKTISIEGYYICSNYVNNWKSDKTIEHVLNAIYSLIIIHITDLGYVNKTKKLLVSLNEITVIEDIRRNLLDRIKQILTSKFKSQ